MKRYTQHMLDSGGWFTLCGKARHFTTEVHHIARTVFSVDCEECKRSQEYIDLKKRVETELAI